MAGEYPGQANADSLPGHRELREGSRRYSSGAIDILVAGDKRFPEESEKFKAQIQELHESGLDWIRPRLSGSGASGTCRIPQVLPIPSE